MIIVLGNYLYNGFEERVDVVNLNGDLLYKISVCDKDVVLLCDDYN